MKGIIEELKELRTADNIDKIEDICSRLDILQKEFEEVNRDGDNNRLISMAREAGIARAYYWIIGGKPYGV